MPELPEVEVTKRGIEHALLNQTISNIYFDNLSLRKPFSPLLHNLENAKIISLERRAKYIVITTTNGYLLLHLGMTGHLKVLSVLDDLPREKHDHFEIETSSGNLVRFNDTRRFGLVLYFDKNSSPYDNEPLKSLGPEPLTDDFDGEYLFNKIKKYKKSIKQTLMDNKVVVGVGNIYASEVLFLSKIDPRRLANQISRDECDTISLNIKEVLTRAIAKGGTTIRDFEGADGRLGYFVEDLYVYGHQGEQCKMCGCKIVSITQGQRTTYYCPNCQH